MVGTEAMQETEEFLPEDGEALENEETQQLYESLEDAFRDDEIVRLKGFDFYLTKPSYEDVMKLRVGMNTARIKQNLPDMMSSKFKKLSAEKKSSVQEKLMMLYDMFIFNVVNLCVTKVLNHKGISVNYNEALIRKVCELTGNGTSPLVRGAKILAGLKDDDVLITKADDPFLSQDTTGGN